MVKPWIAGAAVAVLAGCSTSVPVPSAARHGTAVLRDMDERPIEALPPEILADVRRQMLARGLTSAARELERTYDFSTGKLWTPLPGSPRSVDDKEHTR